VSPTPAQRLTRRISSKLPAWLVARATRRAQEFVHAQFPFLAALGIATVFFALSSPTSQAELLWSSGVVLAFVTTIAAMLFPWWRVPRGWLAIVPTINLIVVGLVRSAAAENAMTVAILIVFPVLWLAYAFKTRAVALVLIGALFITAAPFVIDGRFPQTAQDWSALLLMPISVGFITISVNLAASHLRSFQRKLQDVTAQLKESLAAAEDREVALRAVVDTVDAGIALFGPDGDVLVSNEMAREVVRRSGVDPNGEVQPAPLVFASDRRTPVPPEEQLAMRALRGDHLQGELFWIGPEGDQIALVASSRKALRSTGESVGTVLVVHDVTQLMASIRVREEFLASVSHEMKTPLTSIMGYLEIIEDSVDLEANGIVNELRIVQRNIDRLFAVITDLLTAGHSETPVRRRLTDLRELISSAIETVQPSANAAQVVIHPFSMEDRRGVTAEVDPEKVGQILDNLLSNAIKYTPAGGTIDVDLSSADGLVIFRVTDTGVGISSSDQRQLFDRFFRAESARVEAVPGVGLGLSIVSSLVNAHKGSIDVQSELGGGTSVTVTLPRRP
jgi:two-component system phosphate regulon sensor histidine kinase PhoR